MLPTELSARASKSGHDQTKSEAERALVGCGTGVARAGGSSAGVAAACGAQRRLIEFLEGGEAQTARLL